MHLVGHMVEVLDSYLHLEGRARMSILFNQTERPVRRPISPDNSFGLAGRLLRLTLLMAIGILASSRVVNAASLSPTVKEACGAELRSLCLRPWRLTPDAISQCVEDNRSKLSPACQAFWKTAHMCQLEMKNVCGGLFPLTIKRCLAESGAKFSETCRETLNVK